MITSPRIVTLLLVTFATLAGCAHRRDQWTETVDRQVTPREAPATEEKIVYTSAMATPPHDAYAPQLTVKGYVRIGTIVHEGGGEYAEEVAWRAAKLGADVYVLAFVEDTSYTTKQRGYVIVGSGTAQNPEYSNVTPAQTRFRQRLTFHLWRRG